MFQVQQKSDDSPASDIQLTFLLKCSLFRRYSLIFFGSEFFKPQNKCGQQRNWSQLILVGVWEASWTLINDGGTNVTGWKPIEMFGLRTCRARCVKKTTKKNTDKKRLNLFRHMGSRDLWIDLDLSFLRWVMTCIEVNNFWTSRFWLQIHLFVQSGVSYPQISGAEAMLWSWLMQVFFDGNAGGWKRQHWRWNGICFIKFLEVFCDWAFQPIWTMNLVGIVGWIFQKFVLSFLRNDNLSFWSLYSLEVKPFSALHPHELIEACGRGNVTWKVNPIKPLFMCDTSSFRTTPFDQEFWIWRSLFQ